jgi:hypothetical protein
MPLMPVVGCDTYTESGVLYGHPLGWAPTLLAISNCRYNLLLVTTALAYSTVELVTSTCVNVKTSLI